LDGALILAASLLAVAIILNHPDPAAEPDASKALFTKLLRQSRPLFAILFSPVDSLIRGFWAAFAWLLTVVLRLPLLGPISQALRSSPSHSRLSG
jgi:hypothetical protein